MGTKKIGRPTVAPKINQLRIRLSDEDNEKLIYCSRVTKKPKSDIIRDGINKIYQELQK